VLRAVADTHAIVWFLYDDSRLSSAASNVFEQATAAGDQVGFSAITLAELIYLVEKARIPGHALTRLFDALDQPAAVLVELPFDRRIAAKMPEIDRRQVPDLPDRIIAATALAHAVPLISRDRKIRLTSLETIW